MDEGRDPDHLAEYRGKRDPGRTPEPFDTDAAGPGAPIFVVQRHSARRLHYDLRLERDGVLESWAVPKGIPMEPGTRRMAVHTEDHPLAYADFEGEIPAGEYGGGRVQIWDRGTYEILSRKRDGGVTVRLSGRRLRGVWALAPAHLGGESRNWLIIRKREDDDGDWTGARHAPMLARLVDAPPAGEGWLHEVKWDGFRVLARLHTGEPSLWSRRDQDLTERFAVVARRLERAVRTSECVLDGEVCALDAEGRPDFGMLQRSEGTLAYYVFDLLEADGELLLGRPLAERRERLEALIEPDDPVVHLSPAFPDGAALLAAATRQGLEGVVSKRAASPYRPGDRGGDWVKAKVRLHRPFIIAGYRRGQGGRSRFGALILATRGESGLTWAGNCGSGFTEAVIDDLLSRLRPLERDGSPLATVPAELRRASGRAVWTEPLVVCEVAFSEWTREGRVRAPVYMGVREDVRPEDVRRDAPPPPTAPPPRTAPPASPAREVRITNRDKVFFPDEGITKGDLIAYYRAVAPVLVPHLRDRPFTLIRYPDGIAAERFFQKDRPPNLPDWIPVAPLPSGAGGDARTIRFPLVNEPEAVTWMVNAGCVDMNAWYSRVTSPENPDFVLFDLDPSEGWGFPEAARVALLVRDALALMGLRSYPKTSSGRGIHVMVPVDPVHSFAEGRRLCQVVARALERMHADLVTTTWAKARRNGILIDCNQIGFAKTISSVYSVRPRPGAPVSTPLLWEELEGGVDPLGFTMEVALDRIARHGDLFAPVLEGGQVLDEAISRLR